MEIGIMKGDQEESYKKDDPNQNERVISKVVNARSITMIFGALLSLLALSTLVAGDSSTVIKINSIKATTNANDYFDNMAIDIIDTDRTSKLTTKMPVKKELPDTMMIKLIIILEGQDPIEIESSLCEGMEDEASGKSFVQAGAPKDEFPQVCPFIAGDWTISEWTPPTEPVPPGMEGPFTGTMLFFEEGQDPYIVIEYAGEISAAPPAS